MAMANIENEKWFDVADTVTLNSITIGKIETKEVPSQYSSLYALYHFSDLLSRKIQFLGTSCKDNSVRLRKRKRAAVPQLRFVALEHHAGYGYFELCKPNGT